MFYGLELVHSYFFVVEPMAVVINDPKILSKLTVENMENFDSWKEAKQQIVLELDKLIINLLLLI